MDLLKNNKWLTITLGILLISAGVLISVVSIVNMGIINSILSITCAVILFLFGGLVVLYSIFKSTAGIFDSSIFIGALLITLGVILCIDTSLLPELAVLILSIALISYGALTAIKAVSLLIRKDPNTSLNVIGLIFGLIALTAGILFLCFSRGEILQIIYVTTGVVVALTGVYLIVQLFKTEK